MRRGRASPRCSRSWRRSSKVSRARSSPWSTPTGPAATLVMFLDEVHDLKDRVSRATPDHPRPLPGAPRRGPSPDGWRPTGCGDPRRDDPRPRRSTTGPSADLSRWSTSPRSAHRRRGHPDPHRAVPCRPGPPRACGGAHRAGTDGAASVTIRPTAGRRSSRSVPTTWACRGGLRVRSDLPPMCRGGVCGTCRARLLEGTVQMDANYALSPTRSRRATCSPASTTRHRRRSSSTTTPDPVS